MAILTNMCVDLKKDLLAALQKQKRYHRLELRELNRLMHELETPALVPTQRSYEPEDEGGGE